MTKQHVQLTPQDRDSSTRLTAQGDQKARLYKRALGLLELDRGKTYTQVAHTFGMTHQTLRTWAKKDHILGLDCLKDAPRSGRPVAITGKQRAKTDKMDALMILDDAQRMSFVAWQPPQRARPATASGDETD